MTSHNVSIASQIKTEFSTNKILEMAIRSKEEGQIKFFIRYNSLQKISFDQFTVDATRDEDLDIADIPSEIFRRFCMLIYDTICDLHIDLDYTHIIVDWKFDMSNEADWMKEVKIRINKEVHIKSM